MRILTIASSLSVGLLLSSAMGQQPAPPDNIPPPPVSAAALTPAAFPMSVATQHGRIRGFAAGPGGWLQGLYLSNGEAIELAPDLAAQLASVVRRGSSITVTGDSSVFAGTTTLHAQSVRVGSQTFTAAAGPGPLLSANAAPPPPPPGRHGGPPPPPPPPPPCAPPPPAAGTAPQPPQPPQPPSSPAPSPNPVRPDAQGTPLPQPPR